MRSSPSKRVFLGTGLIGAALAEASCQRGDQVVVWNRTLERARPLEAFGARVASSAAEAVRGADRVHVAVTSDPAADAVLEQIAPALASEAIVIDHSTTSPEGAASRGSRGLRYLHVPVFMSPAACRAATGIMVAAGPRALFDACEAELSAMTGAVRYVGEGGAAATYKLMGNAMILSMVGGLSDVFAIARAQGVSPTDALSLFEDFDPRWVLRGRGAKMAAADFSTSWTLQMARKDLGLMVEAAKGAELAVLPGLGARMDSRMTVDAERDVGILCSEHVKG